MASRTEPLRIGVLLDDWTVPRWVADILAALEGSTYANVVLVITAERTAAEVPSSSLQRLWRNRRSLAFIGYQRIDARLFAREDDPFAPRDARSVLGAKEHLAVTPIETQFSDRFSADALEEIRRHRLDVALRFGFRILRGAALDIAQHGVWSFHHGDNRENRGGPAATWEVLERNPVTGAVLQILTESLDGGQVIGRVNIATDPRSVHRNRCALYERAWPMMPRLLERLHERGRVDVEPPPLAYDRRLYQFPDNAQALRGVARLSSRYLVDRVDRMASVEQWQLGYHLGDGPPATFRFKAVEPPLDRFWADPFPVETDDGYVVFLEEVVHARAGERERGWISSMRIDRRGNVGPVVKVLEEDHHLSYPFVFSWRGDWYMIPESSDADEIVLYRCTRFPDRWERCAVLFAGVAGLDNTLAEIDGRWWLWVTLRLKGTAGADETLLFHAATPLGPFIPHPQNPVVTDARNARGAGRPFLHDGAWIRPAQDGTGRYGRAIVFMRIDRLDLHDYAESEVSRMEPLWSPSIVATHTYNRAGRLQMIDLKKRRPRLRPFTG